MRNSIAALLVLSSWAAFGQDDDIAWLDNYQEAVRVAKATGKPIFIEYRCEP